MTDDVRLEIAKILEREANDYEAWSTSIKEWALSHGYSYQGNTLDVDEAIPQLQVTRKTVKNVKTLFDALSQEELDQLGLDEKEIDILRNMVIEIKRGHK